MQKFVPFFAVFLSQLTQCNDPTHDYIYIDSMRLDRACFPSTHATENNKSLSLSRYEE